MAEGLKDLLSDDHHEFTTITLEDRMWISNEVDMAVRRAITDLVEPRFGILDKRIDALEKRVDRVGTTLDKLVNIVQGVLDMMQLDRARLDRLESRGNSPP